MKFKTLIPTSLNDGSPVDASEIQDILSGLWQQFGGLSVENVVQGHWVDDGQHYQDDSLPVTVATDSDRLEEAKQA